MREFSRSVAATYSGAGIKEFVHVLKEILAYQFRENEYVWKGFDIHDTLLVIFWNGNDFLDDHMATKCDPKVAELLRELSELLNHFPHHCVVATCSSDVWGTSAKFEHIFSSHVAALRRAGTCVLDGTQFRMKLFEASGEPKWHLAKTEEVCKAYAAGLSQLRDFIMRVSWPY